MAVAEEVMKKALRLEAVDFDNRPDGRRADETRLLTAEVCILGWCCRAPVAISLIIVVVFSSGDLWCSWSLSPELTGGVMVVVILWWGFWRMWS